MKTIIIMLFLLQFPVFSQNDEQVVEKLNYYADSVENLIKNTTGAPGEIYTVTVNTMRNLRAIGMQQTKITFFFSQKEDSVYESGNNTFYLPVYSNPLLVAIEYNIAASQSVVVYYYLDGKNYLYRFISSGGYGYTNRAFWFKDEEILQFKEKSSVIGNKETIQTERFSKEVYSDGILVLDNLKQYLELYFNILEIENKDK